MSSYPSTLSSVASPYFTPPERIHLEATLSRTCKAICHIRPPAPGKRGTGFLIGPSLLLTCHHVLPSVAVARKTKIFSFYLDPNGTTAQEYVVHIHPFELDPDSCFITSPYNRSLRNEREVISEANADNMDFTVVGIRANDYLATLQDAVLDIFVAPAPEKEAPIGLIQCPEHENPETLLTGDTRFAYGGIGEVNPNGITFKYNVRTHFGSSGAPVISGDNVVGMHQQATVGEIKIGVVALAIANYLQKNCSENELARLQHHRKPLPISSITSFGASQSISSSPRNRHFTSMPQFIREHCQTTALLQRTADGDVLLESEGSNSSSSSNSPATKQIIECPRATQLFTGRDEDLKKLDDFFSSGKQYVAVTGLGGLGKTTTIIQYAQRHRKDYDLIYFVPSSTEEQLQNGLAKLANELKIPECNLDIRLANLKRKLEDDGKGVLLVIDGVDDIPTLQSLQRWLPTSGEARVLLSSRLERLGEGIDTYPCPLFTSDEAEEYLCKAVKGKDAGGESAKKLVRELGYLPLAIAQAAAFIAYTPGYNFATYLRDWYQDGIKVFNDEAPNINQDPEKTVLRTWKKSIDTIVQKHGCLLAKEILKFAAVLGEAPMPLNIIHACFSTSHRATGLAIGHLKEYSLIQIMSNQFGMEECCSMHCLVQKVAQQESSQKDILDHKGKALQALSEITAKLDITAPPDRRKLDPYVPHLEAAVARPIDPKGAPTCLTPCLKLLWGYYFNEGKYNTALNIANMFPDRSENASTHFRLGMSFGAVNNNQKALDHHQRALKMRKEELSRISISAPTEKITEKIIDSLMQIGLTYRQLNEIEKANDSYEEALKAVKSLLETEKIDKGQDLWIQGICQSFLGAYQNSLDSFKQSLPLKIAALKEDHPDVALNYRNIAIEYEHLKDYEQALVNDQKSLEIRIRVLGQNHPDVADSLYGVGLNLSHLKRSQEAREHFEKALRIQTLCLHPEDPDRKKVEEALRSLSDK